MKVVNRILVLLIVVIYTVVFVITTHAKSLAGYGSDDTETERPYSDDDFYEMSHVIQAEAGYCSWEMMVGVGSVVMNRVKSDKFPDTVYAVYRTEVLIMNRHREQKMRPIMCCEPVEIIRQMFYTKRIFPRERQHILR